MSNTKDTREYLSGHDWGRIMAKAWSDPQFKANLERDPTGTVSEYVKATWPDREYKNIFHIHDKPDDLSTDQVQDICDGKTQMHHCSDLC